jgi:hypothetical protein
MDLLAIARKVWRYKLVTLPVVLLTLAAAAYVVAVKQPVYETSSLYILMSPPTPPTADDIARDPALGRVHADNPYTRFSDPSVVIEILSSSMSSESAQRALLAAGADPRYTVASAAAFGYSSPIVKVTAQGPSPEVAVTSAKEVGNAVIGELDRMQQAKGVDPRYRIKAQEIRAPDGAQVRASGKLRMLVAVLVLGTVLLFVAVSAADALTTLRTERIGPSALAPDDWSEFDEEPARRAASLRFGANGHPRSSQDDRLINLAPDPVRHAAAPKHSGQAQQGSGWRTERRSG